mmetsp:Transcript_15653/g.30569  ORF Transcript_15653/g.30569 Transcript_15653/m.30569 type:complete len:227 (+) Transcript_15653:1-681(+)
MLGIVHTSSSTIPVKIPERIKAAVSSQAFSDNPKDFRFDLCWVVSDVSSILKKGVGSVNLVHHAWVFDDIMPGQRRFMQVPVGVFNLDDQKWLGRLLPAEKAGKGDRDAPIESVSNMRVSVHADKRNKWVMCCSPNNARIHFDSALPAIAFWSTAVNHEAKPPKVLIQLNWMLLGRPSKLYSQLQSCQTLGALLNYMATPEGRAEISTELGGEGPINALLNAFGAL